LPSSGSKLRLKFPSSSELSGFLPSSALQSSSFKVSGSKLLLQAPSFSLPSKFFRASRFESAPSSFSSAPSSAPSCGSSSAPSCGSNFAFSSSFQSPFKVWFFSLPSKSLCDFKFPAFKSLQALWIKLPCQFVKLRFRVPSVPSSCFAMLFGSSSHHQVASKFFVKSLPFSCFKIQVQVAFKLPSSFLQLFCFKVSAPVSVSSSGSSSVSKFLLVSFKLFLQKLASEALFASFASVPCEFSASSNPVSR